MTWGISFLLGHPTSIGLRNFCANSCEMFGKYVVYFVVTLGFDEFLSLYTRCVVDDAK
jgi:hypothetical protein